MGLSGGSGYSGEQENAPLTGIENIRSSNCRLFTCCSTLLYRMWVVRESRCLSRYSGCAVGLVLIFRQEYRNKGLFTSVTGPYRP